MADIKNHSTLPTNLLSYWDLEEASGTRYDLTTNARNLTDNNTVGVATGKIGNASDFIASNSESLSRAAESTWGYNHSGGSDNTNLSVSFWFKADILSGTVGLVGYYTGAQQNDEWLVYLNGTSLILLVRNQGAAVTWGSAISTGVWYHVVATMDSSNNYQLIVNNATPATGSGASGTGDVNIQFRIGAYGTTATGFFDGVIDDVGVWNKKLSAQEITDLYNSGNGLPYYDPNSISGDTTLNTSLVSYWKLDETSGTRNDSKSTNHLTDNNTVLSASGKLNNAADFEATNSEYLSITNASQSGLGVTGNWSVSCWINLESTPSSGNQFFIIGKKQDGDTGGYYLSYENDAGTLKFQFGFQNDSSPFNSIRRVTYTCSTATWYHVYLTCTVASETYGFYVNGVTQSITTVSSGITSPSLTVADFRIGSYGTSGNYFDGLIDEAAFWSKAGTIEEARALYGYGTPPEYSAASSSGPANLKSLNTNLKANIKSINGNLIANCKSYNTNV